MSRENPYDGYDAIDPWDDAVDDGDEDALEGDFGHSEDYEEEGSFEFVEDEYESMEPAEYADRTRTMPRAAPAPGVPTDEFPKTMVRQRPYVEPYREEDRIPEPRGGVLRRSKGSRGRRAHVEELPPPAYDYDYDRGYDRGAYPPPPRQRAPRPPRPRRRRRHGCLVTLLLMVAMVVAAYWVVAHPIDERLAFSPAEQRTVDGTLSFGVPGMPYYVLALGSDAREGDSYSRTDTMVLVRVDIVGGKISLLSIPRDTMVQIDGQGTQKINAAYAFGGAGGAVRAVSELTGVSVNHVAVVHFEELVDLIDYLGGVTVNVPVAVYDPEYTDLALDPGVQTIDGNTALLWARSRHGFEDGDYQRQEDQRILLTAIINRMFSLSPREMPGALNQMGDLIGTDLRCYDLVPLFVRFKLANPTIYSCSVPTTSEYRDDLWYEVVDQAALQRVMQVYKEGGDPSTVA